MMVDFIYKINKFKCVGFLKSFGGKKEQKGIFKKNRYRAIISKENYFFVTKEN